MDRNAQENEVARLRKRLESFREIAFKIASSGSFPDLFTIIVSHLGAVVPFDHVSMILTEPGEDFYRIPVAADFDTGRIKPLEGKTIRSADTFIARVIAENRTIYRPDIARSLPLFVHCRKLVEKGIRADLLVPLRVEGHCIGTLNVASRSVDPFDCEDISFSEDVALQAAVAVDKCRLFAGLQRSKEEVEMYSRRLEEMVEKKTAELREAQQKLINHERLAGIGRLGASLGHELRNPLGVIKNVSYYLSRKIGQGEEKVSRQIRILDREITKAERIINNLLNFSRNRAPVLVPVNIPRIFAQSLRHLKIPPTVKVREAFHPELPEVFADSGELEQVFQNLITNSIQAMPQGGEIRVAADFGGEPAEIRVEFSDTGQGIEPENLDRIFEPLFTTRRGGVGLGLALVKSVVSRHRGRIEVASEPGRGATFSIRLPLDVRGETTGGTAPGDAPGHAKGAAGSAQSIADGG